MLQSKKWISILLMAFITVCLFNMNLTRVFSATNQIKGLNWAAPGDNFQSGVIYPSGLSSSDTYSSAYTTASTLIGAMYSLTGANTVRMPINESTVSGWWSVYTGVIDAALTKGKVILCYWAVSNGKPASITNFYNMWTTVVNKYGSNSNCYFEPINEPYGYSSSDLNNLYYTWITTYPGVSQSRVILDGSKYAQVPSTVGADSRLSGCLLGYHEYLFFNAQSSESAWLSHIQSDIGSYASRTVCTEFGAVMNTGLLDGKTQYNSLLNYDDPNGSDTFIPYIRAITSQFRVWNMGSVYWPGCRDGDIYRLCTKSGSGSGIAMAINNTSGLKRIQYAWGNSITVTAKIKNVATGLFIDGMGRTSNGSNAGQYAGGTSTNQSWVINPSGGNYTILDVATGLYLDGMGRTSSGSICGQYASSSSNNQLWTIETSGNNVKFKNVATGLYLDSAGATSNGADLKQYSSSSSANQQWQIQ